MLLLRTLFAVLLSSAVAGVPGPEAPRPALRSEWFVLEEADAGGPRVSGVVRLVRRARPGATQLESDTTFAREDRANGSVRVLAVEELTPDRASLSWRQIAAGSGRSLRAEWHAGGDGLDVTEWGNGPRWREELASDEGALLPHYLLELLRQGRMATGRVPCFDPLTRSIELLEVATWYEGHSGATGSAVRTVELRRVDRTLFARYRFAGTRLTGFELQEGGPTARAVEEAEYEEHRRALDAAPAAPVAGIGGLPDPRPRPPARPPR